MYHVSTPVNGYVREHRMEFRYQTEDGLIATVRIEQAGEDYRVTVSVGDETARPYTVGARQLAPGTLLLIVGGRRVQAHVAAAEGRRFVALRGRGVVLAPPPRPGKKHSPGAGQDTLAATMPGQVIAVNVAPGAVVERGQTLVVLEAMKMELRVAAPHAGRVLKVACVVGEVVERGQLLVELAPDEAL